MEGSVFKRCGCGAAAGKHLGAKSSKLTGKGHGRWSARYDEPPGMDGRRYQPTIGPFGPKDEAQAELTKALATIHAGTYQPVDRSLTIAIDLERWLAGRIGLKPSTRKENEQIASLYLKPGLGYLRPPDLREHHITSLYAAMRPIGRLTTARPAPTPRRL